MQKTERLSGMHHDKRWHVRSGVWIAESVRGRNRAARGAVGSGEIPDVVRISGGAIFKPHALDMTDGVRRDVPE